MSEPLRSRYGGRADGPLLLLLHGLGTNANVFDRLVGVAEQGWPGGWLAPDLRGHGRSSWAPSYSFDEHAADVAELLDGTREVFVLGHSMGGVVGLALAGTSYEVNLAAVVGLGIKVSWSAEDLDRIGQLAERAPATFQSREEAVDRFLKVAALARLAAVDDPVVTAEPLKCPHCCGQRAAMCSWRGARATRWSAWPTCGPCRRTQYSSAAWATTRRSRTPLPYSSSSSACERARSQSPPLSSIHR